MMRNRILCLALLLGISQLSLAQSRAEGIDFHFGEEIKIKKRSTLTDIIGHDNSGLYAIREDYGGLGRSSSTIIEHYDQELTRTLSKELEVMHKGKELWNEGVLFMNEELHLFSSFYNKEMEKRFLFVQSIDKKTLEPQDNKQLLSEMSTEDGKRRDIGSFDWMTSRDTSKVCIYYNLPYEKKGQEKFGIHILDQGFNELWQNQITLPYGDKYFGIYDYLVGNDGAFYLLGKKYKEDKNLSKEENSFSYIVLKYTRDSDTPSEYEIDLKDLYLRELQLDITLDNDLICAGFFAEEWGASIKGTFFMKIDGETREVLTMDTKEFGLDFLTEHLTEKQAKKVKKREEKGKDIRQMKYDLRDIIIREDGGAIIIGEQYDLRVVTRTTTGANGTTSTSTSYHYYYNDIIVVNVDPNGDIAWVHKIPKRQHTVNDSGFFSSFALWVDGNSLRFIFNDNGKNLFYKDGGELHRFSMAKKTYLVTMVTMDMDGVQKREALFGLDQVETLARPKVCEQLDKNTMIIYGQRGKSSSMTRLSLK